MRQTGNLLIAVLLIAVGLGISALMVLYPRVTPTPAALPPARASAQPSLPQTTEVYSSDGNLKLRLEKTTQADQTSDYFIYVAEASGAGKRLLFTKTLRREESLSLPANAWSPDYKEIFIQQNGLNSLTYLVFKASGEPYGNGEKYLDIANLYARTDSKYQFKAATGWDGYGLVHVTTVGTSGATGPKYWFVTGTKEFLELAS